MTIDSAWAEKETTMLAYHNDPTVKAMYLDRIRRHARADEIIHGKYWEKGKGCAVGCTIHGSKHSLYETELGIPQTGNLGMRNAARADATAQRDAPGL
jgi:phosphoglycerate dehydrogenase-like enzyme